MVGIVKLIRVEAGPRGREEAYPALRRRRMRSHEHIFNVNGERDAYHLRDQDD
ncbi:MAG: hypothetical protein Q9177_000630 [Variospora cf. flavescens]